METYDAHEDILIVCQISHRLEILDVGMLVKTCISSDHASIYCYIQAYTSTYLGGLTRTVVRIAPQYNFTDLV